MSVPDHSAAGTHGLHAGQLLHSLGLKGALAGRTNPRFQEQLDDQPVDDYVAFGWLRGIKDRAVMLQLRRRTGDVLALPYAGLEEIALDPSGAITLVARQRRIQIRGRNLNAEVRPNIRLFDGITRQRVTWVQEAAQLAQAGSVAQAGPYVEDIVL